MNATTTTTTRFPTPGPENTRLAADAAVSRLSALGLKDIVVASNTGVSAKQVLASLGSAGPVNLVVVTHHVGFREPGQDEMSPEVRAELAAAGVKILTASHLFAGVERAVTKQFGGLFSGGVVSNTLRLFGEGAKVAVEIAVMALDAGLIPYGRDIMSLGGSGRGTDTALIVRPAHSPSFFDTRVVEIVCRPFPKR